MRVFAIYLSEDGLMSKAATNVKALFDLIEESGYEPENIFYIGENKKSVEKPYSYNNLLKAMNREGFYGGASIYCKYNNNITVTELCLKSK
jgi:hypothetical protein